MRRNARLVAISALGLVGLLGAPARAEVGSEAARIAPDILDRDAPGTEQYYVSVTGSGNKSGNTQADAMPFDLLSGRVTALKRPAHFHFLPGEYSVDDKTLVDLRDDAAVRANPLLKFTGAGGTTVFKGDYIGFADVSQPYRKALFRINRDNVVIGNFRVRNMGSVVYVGSTDRSNNVVIKNIDATDMGYGITFFKGPEKVIQNWTIDNFNVKNYYEFGIRITGNNTNNIMIKNAIFDAGQNAHDCFIGGVQIYNGAHDITIQDTRIINNRGTCPAGAYQQGDGIEADNADSDLYPSRLTIRNVVSQANGDGSFDLKADDVTLDHTNPVFGEPQHFAYRLWLGKYTLIEPGFDASIKDIQIMGAKVTIRNSAEFARPLVLACGKIPDEPTSIGRNDVPDITLVTPKATTRLLACPQ